MAIQKCPICNNEYDDEKNEKCPFCSGETSETPETEEVTAPVEDTQEAVAKTTEDETADATEDVANGETTADSEAVADEESVVDGETLFDDEVVLKKSNKSLKAVCTVLGVLIVFSAVWLVAAKIAGKDPVKMVQEIVGISGAYSEKDLKGTFIDKENGVYYTFDQDAKDVEVVVKDNKKDEDKKDEDTKVDSASDSAASSDATKDTKKDEPKTKKEKHNGSYTGGYTAEFIHEKLIETYIQQNKLQDEYESYKDKNKVKDEDYDGYVKKMNYADAIQKFDEENQFTAYSKNYEVKGTWKLIDGEIKLYTENGNETNSLFIASQGLVDSRGYMKGEVKNKEKYNSTFTYSEPEYGVTQTFKIYEDGNCMINIDYKEQPDQSQQLAGTYTIKDDKLTIKVQTQEETYKIVDGGLAFYIYNQEKK